MQLRPPRSDAERGVPPELARAFLSSVVEVTMQQGTWTATPQADGRPQIESFPDGAKQLVVLTAHNPRGVAREPHINVAAQQALRKRVQMAAIEVWDAVGRSPDGSWSEPSLALVDLPVAQGVALARSQEQAGFFLWTPGVLTVIWTPASGAVFADMRFCRALLAPA